MTPKIYGTTDPAVLYNLGLYPSEFYENIAPDTSDVDDAVMLMMQLASHEDLSSELDESDETPN